MASTAASATSHYKVLRCAMDASEQEIRDAYKRLILTHHPDKGGSTAMFRQLQVAYETLRDKASRRLYDEKIRAERRKKMFRGPPPMSDVKNPVTFPLPNGEEYVFETAPDRLRCRFRHGDVVEDVTSGQRGVVIGLSTTGLFWCHQGQHVAVPMQTFGGDKDIVVVYRTANGADHWAQRHRPATAAGHKAAHTTSSSSPNGGSSQEASPRAAHHHTDPMKAKARAYRDDLAAQQKQRVVAAMLKNVIKSETLRRETLVVEIEDYFARFHAEVSHVVAAASVPTTRGRRGSLSGLEGSSRARSSSASVNVRRSASMSKPFTPRSTTPRVSSTSSVPASPAMPPPKQDPETARSTSAFGSFRTRASSTGPSTRPTATSAVKPQSPVVPGTPTFSTTPVGAPTGRFSVPISPKLVARMSMQPQSSVSSPLTSASTSSANLPTAAQRARSPLQPHLTNAEAKARVAKMAEDTLALRNELKQALRSE